MVGGTFTGATLTNRGTVESSMAAKFHDFGRWYMVNRYGSGSLGQISANLAGAARDVATEFVNWLLRRIAGGSAPGGTPGSGRPAAEPDLIDRAMELFQSWGR
jgi:hypothetical protein